MDKVTQQILEFEEKYSNEFMTYKVNGYHLWPIVRTSLFMNITSQLHNHEQAHFSSRSSKMARVKEGLSYIINALVLTKNPLFNIPKTNIAFLSRALLRKTILEKKYFDVIYDYYININSKDKVCVIESPYRGKHHSPEYFPGIKYADSLTLLALLSSLIPKSKRSKKIIQMFNEKVSDSIRDFWGESLVLNKIFTVQRMTYFMNYSKLIVTCLEKSGVSIVSIHCCSYGGLYALLTNKLKEKGITVIEFQHGFVNSSHIAYSYGINNQAYSEYLPDYFLTFGQYWSDQLSTYPVKKVTIGNPHLKLMLQKSYDLRSTNPYSQKIILIVSQGICTGVLVDVTYKLRQLLPSDYQIIYKLHPGEIPFREERCGKIEEIKGITIVEYQDIYELLMESNIVVGVCSTTIFEAIAFCEQIYVLDNELSCAYIPDNLGERFINAEDLAGKILHALNKQYKTSEINYYWDNNWERNYRTFLESII